MIMKQSQSNPLIIALDTSSHLKALSIVRQLKVTGVAFKVGFELFTSAGPNLVEKIIGHDVRVFLDLKFHDIPNTVAKAVSYASSMGVWMLNVHASGGTEMMKRAKEASIEAAIKAKQEAPLMTAVTVLTSLKDLAFQNVTQDVSHQVVSLAKLAKESGLDGVVASGYEAKDIREHCGESFCIVTPGIRLPEDSKDDQKRVMTPQEAIHTGSNYLVMGRSILSSAKPLHVIDEILASL